MNINDLECIEFGKPEPALRGINIAELRSFYDDVYGYIPPISLRGLARLKKANTHHGSCLIFRKRELAISLQKNSILDNKTFMAVIEDLLNVGNGYFQLIRNKLGDIIKLEHLCALNMRVKKNNRFGWKTNDGDIIDFRDGEVWHVKEYDTEQNIYGIPDWIGCVQSILLNEDATLFRRKYFRNGCHLGYIFYSTDPNLNKETLDQIRKEIASGKGAGNFRSLFLHVPNGTEKGVQILPIGDISQKDEFQRIKEISANDVIAAHRVPAELAGIIPTISGTKSGDVEKIQKAYRNSEVRGLAVLFLDINSELKPVNRLKFKINDEIIE